MEPLYPASISAGKQPIRSVQVTTSELPGFAVREALRLTTEDPVRRKGLVGTDEAESQGESSARR